MKAPKGSELWTIAQVAGWLSITPRRVQRELIDTGLVKPVQITPRVLRIRVGDLLALIVPTVAKKKREALEKKKKLAPKTARTREDLGGAVLTTRAANALSALGVTNKQEFLEFSDWVALRNLRNVGEDTIEHIKFEQIIMHGREVDR